MNTDIEIRLCEPTDAEALSLVGQATFLEAFAGIIDGKDILGHCARQHSTAVYSGWLADGSARVWISETTIGRAAVGYLVLTKPNLPVSDPRDDDLEIKRIYLLHRFHGSGVGKQLMNTAIDYAQTVGCRRLLLGVYAGNTNAIAFYERLGFKRIGTRRFRVGNNDYDDLVLGRIL